MGVLQCCVMGRCLSLEPNGDSILHSLLIFCLAAPLNIEGGAFAEVSKCGIIVSGVVGLNSIRGRQTKYQ